MLTAKEIYGFSESLLKANFDNPQPTPDLHYEMWDLCCEPSRFVSIAAPRGHAKSTCITHSYGLAKVCFRESFYVILVSDTEEQAVLFLADIKRELQENERLRTLFGIRRFIKDAETDIIVEFNDGERFRIIAKGSEQKLRGRKWRSRRPDLILGDDLENDDIVMNEDRRAKFRRWVNNALLPSLSDDGICRIVGTILHLDSFLENTMPDFNDPQTHTDGLRHWSTKTEEEGRVWHSVRYAGHNPDFSMLLWPEKWPEKRYKLERQRYIEAGDPEGYAQEYLNYPVDEASAFFQKKDFLKWENPGEYLEYYVGGDLAISEKDKRAYTVFVVAGLNRANKLVVVDVARFRGDALEIINEMFRLQLRYEPEIFFLEQENIARSLGAVIDQEMLNRGIYMNIEAMIPTKDKVQRARALQARARAGQVLYDQEADWYSGLYNEMITFPRGKYMDQVDALSWIGLGLNSVVPTYTANEIAGFEYDDEYGDIDDQMNGRNYVTGY
jgi:predicted phage terminase large subunit-like protein